MSERNARQQRLLEILRHSADPLTGTELAARCLVTRQVVVHDVALLRARGEPIVSTPRGYWYQPSASNRQRYVLSVLHPPEATETELHIMVDHGIHVIDVQVEHPVYGVLRGDLHISSRRDVKTFMENLKTSAAALLLTLTDGAHMHTVECDSVERLRDAVHDLRANGIHVFQD